MKVYNVQEGFCDLLKEAMKCEKISDDYATNPSAYITNTYRSATHEYKVVENIDLGVYHSVEKTPIQ